MDPLFDALAAALGCSPERAEMALATLVADLHARGRNLGEAVYPGLGTFRTGPDGLTFEPDAALALIVNHRFDGQHALPMADAPAWDPAPPLPVKAVPVAAVGGATFLPWADYEGLGEVPPASPPTPAPPAVPPLAPAVPYETPASAARPDEAAFARAAPPPYAPPMAAAPPVLPAAAVPAAPEASVPPAPPLPPRPAERRARPWTWPLALVVLAALAGLAYLLLARDEPLSAPPAAAPSRAAANAAPDSARPAAAPVDSLGDTTQAPVSGTPAGPEATISGTPAGPEAPPTTDRPAVAERMRPRASPAPAQPATREPSPAARPARPARPVAAVPASPRPPASRTPAPAPRPAAPPAASPAPTPPPTPAAEDPALKGQEPVELGQAGWTIVVGGAGSAEAAEVRARPLRMRGYRTGVLAGTTADSVAIYRVALGQFATAAAARAALEQGRGALFPADAWLLRLR